MDIFVARQPVFTAKRRIFGYEILFRLGLENSFPGIDGDTATSSVLINTFFTLGLDGILRGRPGLINFTRELILKKTPLLFPQDRIIIEVLENIEPDPEIIKSLTEFRNKGFSIALDDFVYDDKFKSVMPLCSIIKFDIQATPLDTLGSLTEDLKEDFHPTLLAEKVETYHEFNQAKEMGFELFQGFFFSKPEILSGKDISVAQMTKLRLISEINRDDQDLERIESLIKKDVSVSYKLLKFMNSTYFQRIQAVDTIKEALLVLGMDELKKFIHVVVVSELNDTKPDELIRSSIIRARMYEQLGRLIKTDFSGDELFTIGIFSFMDAILDISMDKILERIGLSERIKTALLGRDKQFEKIHTLVACVERGDWSHRLFQVFQGHKVLDRLPKFYMDAVRMADSFFI